MKDQPGLQERMRRARREEWARMSTTRSTVPMYDFVTRASGEDYRAKMDSGEWDDLTRQVIRHIPREQFATIMHKKSGGGMGYILLPLCIHKEMRKYST